MNVGELHKVLECALDSGCGHMQVVLVTGEGYREVINYDPDEDLGYFFVLDTVGPDF